MLTGVDGEYKADDDFEVDKFRIKIWNKDDGNAIVYDNQRVLHARTAFDPCAGVRHIQQCSVDRDEFHNRLRLLAARLGRHDDALMRLPGGALG